jgi:hypothetical protein
MTYREAARKLAALGCREVPRRGGVPTGNGKTRPPTDRQATAGVPGREARAQLDDERRQGRF